MAASCLRVVVWSKPDCGLCDDLLRDLSRAARGLQLEVETRNILEDPVACERFRYLIPVLQVNDGPLHYPPHDRRAVDAALRAALQVDRSCAETADGDS